jgi:alpha-N-arabinofuranosidase
MAKLIINANRPLGKINKNIYGHFSEHLGRCIYGGLYVGEDSAIPNTNGMRNDVVQALRGIRIPVLRWPGGCFADEYHWMDGIGPRETRKRMVNTHWGGVVEDNSFGTHEFMELCAQLNCEPYVNGNLGSGSVREMSEWVEYMTFGGVSPMAELRAAHGRKEPWPLKYFGVGNENWGCGGNMTPEHYADQYRRYQTYVRSYGGNKIYKIACGANDFNYRWTEVLMERARHCMDRLSLHYYTVTGTWAEKGGALGFDENIYYKTLHKALVMDELIENHIRIMRRYDPEHRVEIIVDEWGTWHDVEAGTNPGFLYQQNSMRDALVAAVTLNIFNKHCPYVTMANLAQTVNVLQAVILTQDDQMVLTPTYHVYDLFKHHHDATLLESYVETNLINKDMPVPNLHVSASRDEEGAVHITLANLSAAESYPVEGILAGISANGVSARYIHGAMDAYNDFGSAPVSVKPFTAIKPEKEGFSLDIPACSVMEITAAQRERK